MQSVWQEMEQSFLSLSLKAVTSVATMYNLYQLYDYYIYSLQCEQENRNYTKGALTLIMSPDFKYFLVEFAVCSIHVPPGMSSIISNHWQLWQFLRLYLVMRVIRTNNVVWEKHEEYVKHDTNKATEPSYTHFVGCGLVSSPLWLVFLSLHRCTNLNSAIFSMSDFNSGKAQSRPCWCSA